MKVIGVIGQNGSGKDEVVKYIAGKCGAPLLSTGDMVRQLATEKGIEPTRPNLQRISDEYFKQHGKGAFVKLLADRIRRSGSPLTGITGIRSPEDVAILRQAFGKDFIPFHVCVTDPRERFRRMQFRHEERDPATFDQFLVNDKREEEIFRISQAAKQADFSLPNDGTLEDLHKEIEKVLTENNIIFGGKI